MLIISSKEFRDNQKKYLDRVDNGEQIIVQRGTDKAYALTPISDDDMYFTPEVLRKLNEAIQQVKDGKVTHVKNKTELRDFLNSL